MNKIKTEFELGARYLARGGWIAMVTGISKYDHQLTVVHETPDMSKRGRMRTSNLPDGRFNHEGGTGESEYDLLLPTIGPKIAHPVCGPPDSAKEELKEAWELLNHFVSITIHGCEATRKMAHQWLKRNANFSTGGSEG